MSFCRVSYSDSSGVEHSVSVEASSLYDAIALAVERFQEMCWSSYPPGPGAVMRVEVHPITPQVYTIEMFKVYRFARQSAAGSPAEMVRREKLRKALRIADEPVR